MSIHFWQHREDDRTQLIAVTDEAIYAQHMPHAEAAQRVGELANGGSPTQVFGDKATHIPLRALTRVERDVHDDDIDFSYDEGKDSKSATLTIADAETRASVFAAVEHAVGARFRRYEDNYDKPRAAFGSLVGLTVTLFATWMFAAAAASIRAAEAYEVSGRKQGLKALFAWVLDLLGPVGVTAIGGLLALLIGWHLVNRLKRPPYMQILQAKPYAPPGRFGVGMRYAGLLAVWLFAVKIAIS